MGMVVEHLTFGLGTLDLKYVKTSGYAGSAFDEQKKTGFFASAATVKATDAKGVATGDVAPLWLGKSNEVKLDYPTKDGAEQTIHLGGLKGNFTDRYHLRIYVLEKTDAASGISFTLLSKQGAAPNDKNSEGNATDQDEVLTYKMKIDEFNSHFMSGKPIEISLPSTVKNANILKVTCGTATKGIIKACIEPKAW